jgi:hypothetical protein
MRFTQRSQNIEITKICPACLAYRERPHLREGVHGQGGRCPSPYRPQKDRYMAYVDGSLVCRESGHFYWAKISNAERAAKTARLVTRDGHNLMMTTMLDDRTD